MSNKLSSDETLFRNAIVRTPSQSMIEGISTANLGLPEYNKAIEQHEDYVLALKECGLNVVCLPAEESFPDSTFVEDVALLTSKCAIVTNPGAMSRRGEIAQIQSIVESFYEELERIVAPGTLEAGDVMMVRDHFYIGLSERTNILGANQLIRILEKHSLSGEVVKLSEVLHLKTGLGYLENNQLLASGEFLRKEEFKNFNILEVKQDEAYAANSVWINGTVLIPEGFPNTKQLIATAGYKIRQVDVSEFQKIDGGLSCLSLRF